MTTTFNVIANPLSAPEPTPRRDVARWARPLKLAIIAGAVALAGCSTLRLGYNNAPQLAWWWADGYVDFSREQEPIVRQALAAFFDWHRATQLPELAGLLSRVQPALAQPMTAQTACGWFDEVRQTLDPAIDRAIVQVAELLPQLTEANLRQLEQRYAKNLRELREAQLEASPSERRERSLRRARESYERLYGRLGSEQLQVLQAGLAASPFDAARWLAERQRRQEETLQTLRRLVAERPDTAQRIAALRALAERAQASADAAHRDYQQRLTAYNCALTAQLHNATTPAQRQHAQRQLAGWEGDFRALAGVRATPAATAGWFPASR